MLSSAIISYRLCGFAHGQVNWLDCISKKYPHAAFLFQNKQKNQTTRGADARKRGNPFHSHVNPPVFFQRPFIWRNASPVPWQLAQDPRHSLAFQPDQERDLALYCARSYRCPQRIGGWSLGTSPVRLLTSTHLRVANVVIWAFIVPVIVQAPFLVLNCYKLINNFHSFICFFKIAIIVDLSVVHTGCYLWKRKELWKFLIK